MLFSLMLLGLSILNITSAAVNLTYFPTHVAGNGGASTTGFPYAVYVQISGFTAAASSQVYLKIYNSTNNEYMWKPGTPGAWSNSSTYSASCPIVTLDASGNWSGWIYAKHNQTLGVTVSVRAALVGSTSTNQTSSSRTLTVLTMSGSPDGGWIYMPSSPAVNKGILAYSGGNVVGSYRTEDNSLDEGYSYSSGGFKIAVPVGVIDSLVSINDDGTRDQSFLGPWAITAGQETDASTASGGIGVGTATVSPSMLQGGEAHSLTLKLAGVSPYTITNAKVIIPETWDWSQTSGNINLVGGGSPTLNVTTDTLDISGMTLNGGDTLEIQMSNISPADSTASFSFGTQTGTHPDSIYAIGTQPSIYIYSTPKPISYVKENDANGVPLRNGQLVTVRGIVTVANEFGGPSFIQDNTGGLAIFGSAVSANVAIGDEIVVSGLIQPFSGLNELVNPILHSILSTGNAISPLVLTAYQIANDGAGGVEQYEALLVRVNNVTVAGTGNWVYQNYTLTDASGSTQIRIDNGTNLIGAAIPAGSFDVIAVVSQFQSSSPFIGGYQIQPRFTSDVIAEGPMISTTPYESDITSTSFRMNWTTTNEGTSRLMYGLTASYELGILEPDATLRTTHAVDISGLSEATIYHVKAFSVASGDTSFGFDQLVSTASPAGSTGQINVYFNKSVNTSLAYGEDALGNQDLISKLVARINAAQFSIDACLYSLSANSYGDVVANALVAAKNRGVSVRFIGEYDNIGSSHSILTGSGIPVINDKYDVTWNGQGLMHNKFVVIDYRGGDPEDVWAWTGSWNVTQQGTASDRQNSIEIQDVAVAGAYTTEFNEMWGSSTITPNSSNSRFGGRKTDNTPHRFNVNGVPIEVYFSPSDKTTSQIQNTIGKAQSSLGAALLTFTRSDLASAVITKKNAGKKARILMDNNTDTGNQFANLQTNSVDVHLAGGSGLLHHKYLIVDAENPIGTPYTLTGSHNWSNSAENSNDENTMIVQDARVANLYLQEFAARYYEAGGTDSIQLALAPSFALAPSSLNFDSIDVGASKADSFTVSNSGEGTLTISSATSSNSRFVVSPTNATVPSLGTQTFVVTFSPTSPGYRSARIVLVHNAVGTPDTVLLEGYGKDTTSYVTVEISLKNRWNLLSVPVSMSDLRKTTVFPAAITQAFAYQGTYVSRDTLRQGEGYWVKFSGDQQQSYYGIPVPVDTFSLTSDWNLIGSITNVVPVTAITQVPGGIVQTEYYGYDNGYEPADTLQPGKAYWVKLSETGSLILSSSGGLLAKAENELEKLNRLEIRDASGNSQVLYFGDSPGEKFNASRYQMPPLPPSGAFDVRFKNGSLAAIHEDAMVSSQEFPISTQSITSPVTVRWTISDNTKSYYLRTGNTRAQIPMKGTGEKTISESAAQHLSLNVSDVEIPEVYALGQNFPNPFNPVTTVSFALPKASIVTLNVYNSLGQVVQSVIEQQQRDAGMHSVTIDASALATGVYYYRFDASAVGEVETQFHETKSLMIVK
ncbi:MAG: choice-of-anchor D domain-containing protein [Bacteroidetes bacterium]|nr:MAG: choice-of-anchor D domain-containing protein [Bacteroidota bacterium]